MAVAAPQPYSAELSALDTQSGSLASQQQGIAQQQMKNAQERGVAQQPVTDKMNAAIDKPIPEYKSQPLPEYKPQPIVDPKQFQDFGSMLLAMAAIGGAASKGNWLGVSSALNGSMQGYLDGRHELADKDYKDYQTKFQAAVQKDNQALKEYQNVLQNRKLSLGEMFTQFQIVGAKYDQQDAVMAARQKNLDAMWKAVESRRGALERLQMQHETLDSRLQQSRESNETRKEIARMAHPEAQSSGGGFQGKNGEIMAALAEKGVSLPAGFRSKQQQLGLLNALSERNPNLSPDQIADKIKSGQIDLANLKVEGRTAAGIAGKVAYAEQEIEQTIPLVREASAKLPRGQFVPFNKLKQMGEKEFSDPDLAEFKMYMTSLSNAYDMLAARGGTDVEKRAENRKNFDSAQSPEALERVIRAAQNEARASGRAATKSMDVTHRGGNQPPLKNAQGWTLHKDASGNQAYVGPNNEIEEVSGSGSGGGGGKPKGLLKQGNIDIHDRPVIHNPNGSISTVYSMVAGFEEGGKERYYVIPRAINGRIVSEQAAIQHFRNSHEHLGEFDNEKNANNFSETLHEEQAKEYAQ